MVWVNYELNLATQLASNLGERKENFSDSKQLVNHIIENEMALTSMVQEVMVREISAFLWDTYQNSKQEQA